MLPLLVTAMTSSNTQEQESAAKIVWALCFEKNSRQKVFFHHLCIHRFLVESTLVVNQCIKLCFIPSHARLEVMRALKNITLSKLYTDYMALAVGC